MTGDAAKLRDRLLLSPRAVRQRLLVNFIISEVGNALEDEEGIAPDSRFEASGVGSRSALEIKESLEMVVGRRLETTLLFDYPTPQRLADHLADKIEA